MFHALRRQIVRPYRKPLALFWSKSLLRHPMARSALADMGAGTTFQSIIGPSEVPSKVDRIVMCSGQVYYALERTLQANRHLNVAIVRVEQLSPFPCHAIKAELERIAAATVTAAADRRHAPSLVWCQEEPMNLGMWTYVQPRLTALLRQLMPKEWHGVAVEYAGRNPTAAVATGFKTVHQREELELMATALTGQSDTKVDKYDSAGVPIFAIGQPSKVL